MSKETETKVVEMATEAAPKTIEQLKVRESELDQINDDLIKEMQTREYEIDFSYARAAGLYKGIDTQKDLDYVRTFLN